MKSSFLYSNRK